MRRREEEGRGGGEWAEGRVQGKGTGGMEPPRAGAVVLARRSGIVVVSRAQVWRGGAVLVASRVARV